MPNFLRLLTANTPDYNLMPLKRSAFKITDTELKVIAALAIIGDVIPPGLPRAEIEARVHAAINALEA